MSLEFLQVADAVAREKNIQKDQIIEVMEQAFEMAAKRKFGMDLNVKAHMDRVDGTVAMKKLIHVVEVVMEPISLDEVKLAQREMREPKMQPAVDVKTGVPLLQNANQMVLSEARKVNPAIQLGEYLTEDLPPMDFGRIAAMAAKQVIFQKVRDAERGKEFEEYKDKQGEVVSGIVKRTDFNGTVIDMGKAEAFLPKEETIGRESFKPNDRVRGYIYKVEQRPRGPQIFISRTHPQFLVKLFAEVVPEIANGTIEVVGAARDPGFRAKIAVKSADRNMDPVGACVGVRGVRVQAVTNELQGERVDIIPWSANPAEFLVRAMQPAEVTKVVLDEEDNRIEVVVPEDKLSLAIGKRGQNVRLASQLTGWNIDVMSAQEESDRRNQELTALTQNFIEKLDVDDTLARLLIAEGFQTTEDLLKVSAEELGRTQGLDITVAGELQRRAQACVDEQSKKINQLGVAEDLAKFPGISTDMLVILADKGIKTLDDFADLATDELMELLPAGMVADKAAEKMIMRARQHWFDADENATAQQASA